LADLLDPRLSQDLLLPPEHPVLSTKADQLGPFLGGEPFTAPSSTSAWRSQVRRQDSEIPMSAAICAIGFARSRASSMALRRNSGG
jgi:hypothetical protein